VGTPAVAATAWSAADSPDPGCSSGLGLFVCLIAVSLFVQALAVRLTVRGYAAAFSTKPDPPGCFSSRSRPPPPDPVRNRFGAGVSRTRLRRNLTRWAARLVARVWWTRVFRSRLSRPSYSGIPQPAELVRRGYPPSIIGPKGAELRSLKQACFQQNRPRADYRCRPLRDGGVFFFFERGFPPIGRPKC